MVLAGGVVLMECAGPVGDPDFTTAPQKNNRRSFDSPSLRSGSLSMTDKVGYTESEESGAKGEAAND